MTVLREGCHSPVTIKFPGSNPPPSDISSEYLRSINPCNSSDTKRNARYFWLQYSYVLSSLWQVCSSLDSNGIIRYLMHNFTELRTPFLHILCPEQYSREMTTCKNTFSLTFPFPPTFPTLKFPDFSKFSRWVITLLTACRPALTAGLYVHTKPLQ